MNVLNLVLVRSQTRLKELAIRSSIGAGRLRIARQLGIEMLLLSLGSAALGVSYRPRSRSKSFDPSASTSSRGEPRFVSTSSLSGSPSRPRSSSVSCSPSFPSSRMLGMNLSDIVHQEGRTSTGGRGAAFLAEGAGGRAGRVRARSPHRGRSSSRELPPRARDRPGLSPGIRADGLGQSSAGLATTRRAAMVTFHERALAGIRSIAGVESGGSDVGHSFRRELQRQRDHGRGLPDGARRVADLSREDGGDSGVLRDDGHPASARSPVRGRATTGARRT